MKVGLILIGGSLKGIYGHTGVVSALRTLNIKPDVILGASAGSIVGSFMATGMPQEQMKHKMLTLTAEQFLDRISRWKILKEMVVNHGSKFYGFIKGDKLEEYVHNAVGPEKDDFSKCEIPYYVSGTNLKTYRLSLFNTGAISEKARASCAIPMMFCPKKIDNQYYIDGALRKDKLPKALVEVCPDLDHIIVSNFSYEQETEDNSYIENADIPMLEIVRRAMVVNEKYFWPRKIGKTKVFYLEPGLTTPVDIFHPSPQIANSVYHDSAKHAKYHLERYFKRVSRKKPEPPPPTETPQA